MTRRKDWVDPIAYAWRLCNPNTPLPEVLRFDPRVIPK